jgi:hypothetical protein
MKTLSILITSLLMTTVYAQSLPVGVSVLTATTLEVLTPMPKCAPTVACDFTTDLHATYTALGCLDRVVVTASRDSDMTAMGKIRVNLSAVNIHNPESDHVKCFVAPTKTAVLTLGRGSISKEDVEVVQLKRLL